MRLIHRLFLGVLVLCQVGAALRCYPPDSVELTREKFAFCHELSAGAVTLYWNHHYTGG